MRTKSHDADPQFGPDTSAPLPVSPGKVTLTAKLARFARGTEPVQAAKPASSAPRAEEQLLLISHDLPATGGAPLPGAVQAKMSTAFGTDFSSVRVHQDDRAGAIGAQAFASGDSLHFAPGQYDPSSESGQALIGHELAHVVQQRAGRVAAPAQGSGLVIDDALEREADDLGARAARGEVVAAGSTGTAMPGVVQGKDASAEAAGDELAPADADVALRAATFYMMRYGFTVGKQEVVPQLAAAVDAIGQACANAAVEPAGRRAQLEQGITGLAPALAAAKPELVAEFNAEVAVVRAHLDQETLARDATGVDPLAELLETRSTLGMAGAAAMEMAKLVDLANTKRLVAARKVVDWSAFGEILAKNVQLVPTESGELKEAFGAFEGASFELGFRLLDAALTVAAAGEKLGGRPAAPDPAEQAKLAKAVIDMAIGVLNGCMATGRLVALYSAELCEGEEALMWHELADSLGKGLKLAGGTFAALTAACDLVTNAVILWNGAEGIEAADAMVGMAGASAAILAEGSKLLLETGLIAPAEGMFAGATAGAVVAEIAAIATPLAVAIPLGWIVTKAILIKMGEVRIGITGALMAQGFDNLAADAGGVSRETAVLGVALHDALDPSADPATVENAVRGRVDLVRAQIGQLQTRAMNQRANVLKREVSALLASTRALQVTDPLEVGAAAHELIHGVIAILDRSPELVAEEAGDPTFADRARQGAPAPGSEEASESDAPDECEQE